MKIKSECLKIENEDSLFDMINEFFEKEEEKKSKSKLSIIDFYEKINLEFLSEDKFTELIEKLKANDLTTILWLKLKKCFYMNKDLPKENVGDRYNYIGRKIEYDGNVENAFKGIICQLTKESGGNVDDKGIVKVTASSELNNYFAKYAVDLDDCNNYFESNDISNSWLQYDFQNQRIRPTHYSIRTRHDNGKGGYHPKNWDIEGSNDGEKWITLDSRQNITCLDDRSAIHTFDIQTPQKNDDFYQFLRIRFTGPNIANNNYMVLSALEYFGIIM